MTEATVVRWLVASGDRVEKKQLLVEIESEKTVSDIESPADGTLADCSVAEGDVAAVGRTIACYSFSLAPVTWVLIAEIFPNRIRGAAVSVAVSAMWIACFILTFTFPILNDALGPARTFWLYAAICAAGFVFIFVYVSETKGKSLEQIERELVD